MWVQSEVSGDIINLDNVASMAVYKNQRNEWFIAALLPSGQSHMLIKQFQTPEMAKHALEMLIEKVGGYYRVPPEVIQTK